MKSLKDQFPSTMDRAYSIFKQNRHVFDIMSRDVATIGREASMAEAARLMGKRRVGSLVITEGGVPSAIVTERDLLSRVIAQGKDPAKVKVADVMASPPVTVSPNLTVKEAARVMMREKGRLIVVDREKMVGVVTASDLISAIPEFPEGKLKVADFMTKKVVTAEAETLIKDVAKMLGEKRIGSVIVASKGKPPKIFTERDLVTKILGRGKSLGGQVGGASSSPLVKIDKGASVHEAALTMIKRRVRRLPVYDGEKMVGIITARDLVEAYSK